MKPVARLSPVVFSLSVDLSLSCVPDRASGPRLAPSFDRSTAPGLDVACRDKPGNHLARRPNAPVELLCALTLPAGSQPIQNITKSWVGGGRLYATELKNASVYIWDVVSHDYVGRVTGFVAVFGESYARHRRSCSVCFRLAPLRPRDRRPDGRRAASVRPVARPASGPTRSRSIPTIGSSLSRIRLP